MQLFIHALHTCFWCRSPHSSSPPRRFNHLCSSGGQQNYNLLYHWYCHLPCKLLVWHAKRAYIFMVWCINPSRPNYSRSIMLLAWHLAHYVASSIMTKKSFHNLHHLEQCRNMLEKANTFLCFWKKIAYRGLKDQRYHHVFILTKKKSLLLLVIWLWLWQRKCRWRLYCTKPIGSQKCAGIYYASELPKPNIYFPWWT